MKLSVLSDDMVLPGHYTLAEHGLSFYLEEDGTQILFDTGYSGLFLENAGQMGIDLRHLDYLVLSHGHLDHTWGMHALLRLFFESAREHIEFQRPTLIAHPEVFNTKVKEPYPETGMLLSQEKAARQMALQLSREPVWLTENLVFLGEISRVHDFEAAAPFGIVENGRGQRDDMLEDDSGLAWRGRDGLVIITGCAHAGICNTVDHARKVCGGERVSAIIGGLHLQSPSEERMAPTTEFIRDLKLDAIYPCHCTDLPSRMRLGNAAPLETAGTGLTVTF
jgi:7,8-dihydropterin-6-yl-methyl-4-(beta-D-ribofuranosyl)aminobenzene 5'-phosphate synthase